MIQLLKQGKKIPLFVMSLTVGLSFNAEAQNLSTAEAADIARKQAGGGKVLKVKPFDSNKRGYKVRILTESGQVKELFIPDQKDN